MIISQIVATGIHNEIGKNNDLLWRLPNDMKFFKETTTGHCVLMGRNTFESFGGKPLKNRTNIVVTRQTDFVGEGCIVVNSVEKGIEYARQQGEEELFIIGGGTIYEQTLPQTNKVYLTFVHAAFDATVFFPVLNREQWKTTREDEYTKDERHAYDYTFFTFEKIEQQH